MQWQAGCLSYVKKMNIIKSLSLTAHIAIQLHMRHEVTVLVQISYNIVYA
jgi:hypothetical protein